VWATQPQYWWNSTLFLAEREAMKTLEKENVGQFEICSISGILTPALANLDKVVLISFISVNRTKSH
jgi:hypothetical protein